MDVMLHAVLRYATIEECPAHRPNMANRSTAVALHSPKSYLPFALHNALLPSRSYFALHLLSQSVFILVVLALVVPFSPCIDASLLKIY